MLLFSQKTGELISILLDVGCLTNIRTAAAGAIAAKYLAPKRVHQIGIFGAGTQGRLQLDFLRRVVDCRKAIVWGISEEELALYKKDMEALGFTIRTTFDAEEVAATSNLVVTCTPSKTPLLRASQVKRGTHITAMGSDTPEKQELDPEILKRADRVVVDSLSQAQLRGECFQAMKQGAIGRDKLVELGQVIADKKLWRQRENETTVVDLTGVAIQDIQIAKAVWKSLA
jgi:ornithine cyclodeaminase